MHTFLRTLFVVAKGKDDKDRKYRLISSNYWKWHIKWNVFMAVLLGIPAFGYITESHPDPITTTGIVIGFLCVFAVMAKMTYDTDRWDRCTKCECQYTDESKYCSCCGTAREDNVIDGITWRLEKERKEKTKSR